MTSRSEKDATPVHPGDMRAQLRHVCENIGAGLAFCVLEEVASCFFTICDCKTWPCAIKLLLP
jgi:hypothetical protein